MEYNLTHKEKLDALIEEWDYRLAQAKRYEKGAYIKNVIGDKIGEEQFVKLAEEEREKAVLASREWEKLNKLESDGE